MTLIKQIRALTNLVSVDTISFKDDSAEPLIQLADAVAYLTTTRLSGNESKNHFEIWARKYIDPVYQDTGILSDERVYIARLISIEYIALNASGSADTRASLQQFLEFSRKIRIEETVNETQREEIKDFLKRLYPSDK